MNAAERAALIARAKACAIPVVSCFRAGVRTGHLTGDLDRNGLLALVEVLAWCAAPDRLEQVTRLPGDGMRPAAREDTLKRARREAWRLRRDGAVVPLPLRALEAEYFREAKRRQREASRRAAAGEGQQRGEEAA